MGFLVLVRTVKNAQNVAIWVPGAKISKPLNVCRDCGFSWEDR